MEIRKNVLAKSDKATKLEICEPGATKKEVFSALKKIARTPKPCPKRDAQDKYPNGRPFIGRYEEPEGQQKLNVIEFPFHTMAKFQEKLREVQDFQNRQKMKGKTAT